MAGRKSNANIQEPSAYLEVEVKKENEVIDGLYRISCDMDFIYGSKIPKGMKRKVFRNYLNYPVTKDNAKVMKESIIAQGQKNVKLEKMKINLPSKCPRCKNNGTPTMYQGKGTVRISDKHNEVNRDEIRLIYNHSRTLPKTCLIGTVNLKFPLEIKLTSKLKIDSLSFRNRVGEYPLPKGFTLSE